MKKAAGHYGPLPLCPSGSIQMIVDDPDIAQLRQLLQQQVADPAVKGAV